MAIGDYLEQYTYPILIKSALSKVPKSIDSREGSVIYDALAPACYELANYYMRLRKLLMETFAITASGEYLDLRVAEQGVKRYAETRAKKRGDFTHSDGTPTVVPLGARFSTVGESKPINYVIIEQYEQNENAVLGAYVLQCEEFGTCGNSYIGELLPITYIHNLGSATMSDLIVPARDTETDDDLRIRYFLAINDKPFGGNVAQYDQELKAIAGVGEVQVYPVWNGGGTVKCSVIDTELNIVTSDFLDLLQQAIDPENMDGERGDGLGLAPIGHVVTVVTPSEVVLNITATIRLMSGYNRAAVQAAVEVAITEYIITLKKNWGVGDELNRYALSIYTSRITAAILSVSGIANVTNIMVNGQSGDIELEQSSALQQLPKLGTVTLDG